MRNRGIMGGRAGVALGLAVVMATPGVRAAPVASEAIALDMQMRAEEAYDRGEELAGQSAPTAAARFEDAGRLFLGAAIHRSGAEATTLRWYALKAFMRARELDPQGEGGQKAREICKQAIGPEGEARGDPRFLDKCAALAPKPPLPPPPAPRGGARTAGATEGANVASRPTPDVTGVGGPRRGADVPADPTRGLKIGLWTTVALTGVFGAVALGTGLARVREPFQGVAYRRIREAAAASLDDASEADDIAGDQGVDMCVLARYSAEPGMVRNAKVADACTSFDRLEVASKVTGVAAGVFLGASVALLGLLLKRRRAALDRRRAQLGATRLPGGGVLVTGGFAF